MTDYPRALCTSCHAPIIWTVTERGARMPVDADMSDDGILVLDDRGGNVPLARVVSTAHRFGRKDLHTSHFATCPNAAKHRKRGRA